MPLPCFAHEQVGRGKLVNGLAHRALADAKPCGQIELTGNHFARLPLCIFKALQNLRLYLLIQRAECGRAQGACVAIIRGVGCGGVYLGCSHGDVFSAGAVARRSPLMVSKNYILYKTQDVDF